MMEGAPYYSPGPRAFIALSADYTAGNYLLQVGVNDVDFSDEHEGIGCVLDITTQ